MKEPLAAAVTTPIRTMTGLKGLAITPPVIGRISIGKVVDRAGKRLPEKDDQFTLTTQVHEKDGWRLHPLDEQLRQGVGAKLRSIPVRMPFNDPTLNLRSVFCRFDRKTSRPTCVGNGEHCQRSTAEGMRVLPCPSPDLCELAEGGQCKPYGRLHVLIGDDDPTGTFIFRTTSFNSIRTLTARLSYFSALSGDRLACLPLELRLRGKSTSQSFGQPIYYVDLVLSSGVTISDALDKAESLSQERKRTGFDQAALDESARLGFAQCAFEESGEDADSVIPEFYPEMEYSSGDPKGSGCQIKSGEKEVSPLRKKLSEQVKS